MDILPADLVLSIAERMDIKSLLKLKQSNQRLYAILTLYERSVSTARIAGFTIPPSPTCAILSSEVFLRRILRNGSFEMVHELEQRESRICDILKNPRYIGLQWPAHLGRLTDAQQEHLYVLLKRAMWQCDHIADRAANVPEKSITTQYYGEFKPDTTEEEEENGDAPVLWRSFDPYTNYYARPVQFGSIDRLSAQDVTMIYYLLDLMGTGFVDTYGTWNSPGTTLAESVVMFEECVLRHGSWFAWAHIFGNTAWCEMSNYIIKVGLSELRSYEEGDDEVMYSLKSALIHRFNELHPESKGNGILPMRAAVRRLILGVDSEEEYEN
ncbi:hypothetical protein F5Y04DRAFT_241636 [Hypomontagnella monticulosa]|nr:hypothetical protein F5Y04DRAFT_241636 [Hypomontagnella monticulosa]